MSGAPASPAPYPVLPGGDEEGRREGGGEEAGAGFGGQKPRDRAPSTSAEVAQAAALAGALGSCFPARATPSEVPTSPTRSARC